MNDKLNCVEWKNLTFAIVGLGLIGGSYAKKLRSLGVKKIIGIENDPLILEKCLQEKIIDSGSIEANEILGEADVIICSIYPEAMYEFFELAGQYFKVGALITDTAGVKSDFVEKLQRLLPDYVEFIAGHPMAGRQGSGIDLADEKIFAGANYIVVPTKVNTDTSINYLKKIVKGLGAGAVVELDAATHDEVIAYTSNLPHILAVSLINSASYSVMTKSFIAGSFKDGTRVAEINPRLWSELFLCNKDNVIREINLLKQQLDCWTLALETKDRSALMDMMTEAGRRRRQLD